MRIRTQIGAVLVGLVALGASGAGWSQESAEPSPTQVKKERRVVCEARGGQAPQCRKLNGASGSVPNAHGAVDALDAFGDALRNGDTEGAAKWLDPDLLVFEGGESETLPQYLSAHLKADADFMRDARTSDRLRQVRLVNGMAVITTTDKLQVGDKTLQAAETAVLKQRNGQWRILHLHWSSRKAK